MAEAQVNTIRRLYIKDRDKARSSIVHTVYAGAASVEPGKPQPLKTLQFVFGVAQDIPTQDAKLFMDLGHAIKERPKSAIEEAEERELRDGR